GKIEFCGKDVDHPNGIVLADPVFQAFRKQRALPAIRALNEAPHPTLPRIISRESHQKRRFHTGSVKPGHCGDVCYTTALPPKADVRPRSCYVAEVPNSDITDRMGPRDFAERDLWNVGFREPRPYSALMLAVR